MFSDWNLGNTVICRENTRRLEKCITNKAPTSHVFLINKANPFGSITISLQLLTWRRCIELKFPVQHYVQDLITHKLQIINIYGVGCNYGKYLVKSFKLFLYLITEV